MGGGSTNGKKVILLIKMGIIRKSTGYWGFLNENNY